MDAITFEGTPMTKREVLISRLAFRLGAAYEWEWLQEPHTREDFYNRSSRREARAAEEYPLPKVTRVRVVRDPHCALAISAPIHWEACGDEVITCYATGERMDTGDWECSVTGSRIALWADLLANPTEEVDE